jgi:rubredoxin
MNESSLKQSFPVCPRCDTDKTVVIAKSVVIDVWEAYSCPVCHFVWRSTEPESITNPAKYPAAFKLKPEDIPGFPSLPAI